ncbi:MAG: type II secretion system protein GspC [Anaeromyxobacteraceae bacterium]
MLDLFFRKYAWTANLVMVFAAAWFTAKTVNTLIGSTIRPTPQANVVQPAGPPPRPTLPATLDLDAVYRLIGQQQPRAVEEPVAQSGPVTPQNCDDSRASPSKSDVRMQLVATVIADRSRFSLATLNDLASRETHVLGVGDQLGSIRLLGVERVRDDRDATGNGFRVVALICNAGTKEYLDFEGGPGGETVASAGTLGLAPLPPAAPRAPGAPAAAGAGVRQLADNRYEIDRNTIDSWLSNMSGIATQARIVPSFRNGVANGFKLFSIQPGSLYASIGVENGDVIQRVNGYEINSPEKALELYQKLRESSHVTIELDRGGQVIRKEYNISGP